MIEDQKFNLKHIFKSRNYQFNQSINKRGIQTNEQLGILIDQTNQSRKPPNKFANFILKKKKKNISNWANLFRG